MPLAIKFLSQTEFGFKTIICQAANDHEGCGAAQVIQARLSENPCCFAQRPLRETLSGDFYFEKA
jgi:hypothetical protein